MEERKLNFDRGDDQKIIPFDKKTFDKAQKQFSEVYFALNHCMERYEAGKLRDSLWRATLGVAEHKLVEGLKIMGYEGILEEEKEERYAEIRVLNQQNRELRAQLGGKVTLEDMREKLKNIYDGVRAWWSTVLDGLIYVTYEQYSAKIKVSGMLHSKKKIDRAKELGFQVSAEDGSTASLIDNQHNRDLLLAVFEEKFPGIEYHNIDNYCNSRKGAFEIRDAHFWLRNYDSFESVIGFKAEEDSDA